MNDNDKPPDATKVVWVVGLICLFVVGGTLIYLLMDGFIQAVLKGNA